MQSFRLTVTLLIFSLLLQGTSSADQDDLRDILSIPAQTVSPGGTIKIIWEELPFDPPWQLAMIMLHRIDRSDAGIPLWMGPYMGSADIQPPVEWNLDIPDVDPGEYELVFTWGQPVREYIAAIDIGGSGVSNNRENFTPPDRTPVNVPESPPFGLPPCDEAYFFYDRETIGSYYTEEPSLNFSRQDLVRQMVDAMDRYVDDNGTLVNDVGLTDAPFIAQSLDSSSLRQGTEQQLIDMVREYYDDHAGPRITPGDLFFMSLKVNRGNVKAALLTCHSVLWRDSSGNNAAFIDQYCLPIRNPDGYSDRKTQIRRSRVQNIPVSPRETAGNDQQGVWYHFFGMAAVEFTDRNGITPFAAVTTFAGIYKGEVAKKVAEDFPMSEAGGRLSNYAVALENAVRSADGAPPDPDKHCINYSGIAAGQAIAQRLDTGRLSKPPPPSHSETITLHTPHPGFNSPRTSCMSLSPVSMEITGTNGEWFTFDQNTKMFDASTPWVIIDTIPEDDGTWGLVVTPLFEIEEIVLTGTEDGDVTWAVFDNETSDCSVYSFDVENGDEVVTRIDDHKPVVNIAGSVLEPEYVHHYSSGFGLRGLTVAGRLWIPAVIGLFVVLMLVAAVRKSRRRKAAISSASGAYADQVFRAPDPARFCPACGHKIEAGSAFCRQCGKRL